MTGMLIEEIERLVAVIREVHDRLPSCGEKGILAAALVRYNPQVTEDQVHRDREF